MAKPKSKPRGIAQDAIKRGTRVKVQWVDIINHSHSENEEECSSPTFTGEWRFLCWSGRGKKRVLKLANTFCDSTGKPYGVEVIPAGCILKLEVLK